MLILEREKFDDFLDTVRSFGYKIIGPKVKDHAICYESIGDTSDLPIGITDEQSPGYYRLKETNSQTLFNYVVGPDTCKKIFYPPKQPGYSIDVSIPTLTIHPMPSKTEKLALLGVRACEIAALKVQDRVFNTSDRKNEHYIKRRKNNIVIAVNCTKSEANCFCTSMDTGPKATNNFDIALTEIYEKKQHYFVAKSGSDIGTRILAKLQLAKASVDQIALADKKINQTAHDMQKKMNTQNIKETIYNNLDNPIWDEIETRCLSCGNCTQSCPTCFCTNTVHKTDLDKAAVQVSSEWASCFERDISYLVGDVVRKSTKSRYRQWLSHKLATWIDQFGTSGCVGCGRCITWCPVGIDITEEVKRLQKNEKEV